MIPATAYFAIFLVLVTIFSIPVIGNYNKTLSLNYIDNKNIALGLALFLTVFIGLRPVHHVFADMVGYAESYDYYSKFVWSLDFYCENLLFDNITSLFASSGVPKDLYFTLLAALYFLGTYIACRKMFPSNTLVSYLVFLAAFSTFAYATNGMKAGVAGAVFLCGVAYKNTSKWLSFVLVITSFGFHHSMSLCVLAYVAVFLYKNPKWYFYFWLFCLAMSIAHVSFFQVLFMQYSDAKGATYLDSDNMAGWDGKTGFRADFTLYSAMPVLIGYYAIYKKKIQSDSYNMLLCLYLLTNGVWLLCMYAGFTNRIAYLSWFMYPMVLVYPYLQNESIWKGRRYKALATAISLHLCFTLFMYTIYY